MTGLLSRIGQYNPEARNYIGARQTRFVIHPSSGLAKKPPAWVMAFELVHTTQLFARGVAKIDPEWLDDVGGHLLKRTYTDPHWAEKAARARIKEHATLFGLPVFRDRRVDYATIAPVRARLMFIEHALVRGEYTSRGAFQEKNRELMLEVARLRDKARKSDMLADEEALVAFFDRRLPDDITNGKAFESWREKAEAEDPGLLQLRLEDVLGAADPIDPAAYPDVLTLHGAEVALSYVFDPSAENDGVTLTLPLALLPQLEPSELDWIIPAWHTEKIAALLESLPKALRRDLGSAAELSARVAPKLAPFAGALLPALSRAVFEVTLVQVPVSAWRLDAIPRHLRFVFRVVGERGNVIAESRDLAQLLEEHGGRARAALSSAAPDERWERSGLVTWSFGELPEHVTRSVLGATIRRYPALVDRGQSVDLCLLESASAAEQATLGGVARLCALGVQKALAALAKTCPSPFPRLDRMPPSRAERAAFCERVLARSVREAFGLKPGARLPRRRDEYLALFNTGSPRLEPAFRALARSIGAASAELDKTLAQLAGLAKQPSATHASRDVRAQLEQLFFPELVDTLELERLEQYPRYLRAAQTRLSRAVVDPRKDADKLAPFAPLWTTFLEKQPRARDARAAEALRWAFEELRVAIFAPELKPAKAVSLASVSSALSAL